MTIFISQAHYDGKGDSDEATRTQLYHKIQRATVVINPSNDQRHFQDLILTSDDFYSAVGHPSRRYAHLTDQEK